jgi:hypothetical protein
MSDKKISQLPASTTPLAGTEELPLVQSGTTKKVAVGSMFGANVYTFLNTPNSANLAAAVTDETGTGALVFGTNPTFINSGSANPSATFANTAFQDVLVNYFMANNGNKITLQFASDNGATLTNSITSYGSAAGGVPSLNNVIEMGNASGKVRVTTTGDVLATTGNLVIGTAGKGIDFSAAGGDVLAQYDAGSATLTATGMTTSPTGSATYAVVGKSVVLDLPTITGTSNDNSFTLTGLPAVATPANDKRVVVQVNDNGGAIFYGMANIGSNGVITLYTSPQGSTFISSGTKGVYFCSVSYTLA